MAAATIGAEFAVVHIVGAMAVAATAVCGLNPGERCAVTIVAANLSMCAVQREFSLYVMIEAPELPGNRVVAAVTAILEVALVRVIIAMAGNALDRFIRIGLGRMTTVTFLLAMHTM